MKDDESEPNEFESIDVADKVEIFATTDDKIKFLGELLSNESSRTILVLLTEKEMSANDIAEKIGLRLSLVIHHLNKMIQVSIVEVSRIGKSAKNHDVKFYSAKPGILIFPKDTADIAKQSKTFSNSLKKVFKEGTKFAIIGISAIVSYSLFANKDSIPQVDTPIFPQIGQTDPLVYPLIVIIIGLAVLYLKKRKKG